MLVEEEADTVKALKKDMEPFSGDTEAESEWPIFSACLDALLRLLSYSLGSQLLETTPANSANSACLAFLLSLKLCGAAMEPFLNNPSYMGLRWWHVFVLHMPHLTCLPCTPILSPSSTLRWHLLTRWSIISPKFVVITLVCAMRVLLCIRTSLSWLSWKDFMMDFNCFGMIFLCVCSRMLIYPWNY